MAASGLAAQSGVLLGLVDPNAAYRTLWITTTGDSAAIMATGDGLIVPRRGGFWHVAVLPACTTFEPASASYPPACDHRVDIVKLGEQHGSVEPKAIVTDPDTLGAVGPCWSQTTETALFVGTRSMSLGTEVYDEGCTPSGWFRETVVVLYALARRSLATDDDLVPLTLERYVDEKVMAAVDSSREAFFGSGQENDWADCESGRGIGIARGPGRFEVAGWSTGTHACGHPAASYLSGVPAPVELVGYNKLVPSLDTLRTVVPEALDAVASPHGDLIVVLTDDAILALRVNSRGVLGPPRRLAASPGRIVMAEWATDDDVARWTANLSSLLGR